MTPFFEHGDFIVGFIHYKLKYYLLLANTDAINPIASPISNPIDTFLINIPRARPRTIETINATSPLPLFVCVLINNLKLQFVHLVLFPAEL